jgi:hypothetical protein
MLAPRWRGRAVWRGFVNAETAQKQHTIRWFSDTGMWGWGRPAMFFPCAPTKVQATVGVI